MCGGGVCGILLFPLVTGCIATIHVYIRRMFIFYICCSDCVRFCGNAYCGAAVVKDSAFSLRVLKYAVCVCNGCCVFCLYCDAWICRCSYMGSISVSPCICCMFVSCVHPVAVIKAAFCITCRLLMLVENSRGDHMEEAYSRAGLMTAL